MACDLALAQINGQAINSGVSSEATLGFVYLTEGLGNSSANILDLLRERTGINDWVGAVGMGICASGAEYINEPAIAIMLSDIAPANYQIYSGRKRAPQLSQRTGSGATLSHTALIHADPGTGDVQELINDMADRTETGFLFGGITSGKATAGQIALDDVSGGAMSGGISGVVFSSDVKLMTRITQGCSPLGKEHTVSAAQGNYLKSLDESPALDVMLKDLGVDEAKRQSRDGREILRLIGESPLQKGLLIGVAPKGSDLGGKPMGFGDYVVRHIVGIDPINRIVAVGDHIQPDDRAVFCTRDAQAARRDLIRICAELRDEAEESNLTIQGALYFSCVARGPNTFGDTGAELAIIKHNLGDVPLVGFYANGEIARNKLYGYTGVLTLFVK